MSKGSVTRIGRKLAAKHTDILRKRLHDAVKELLFISNEMGAQALLIARDSPEHVAKIHMLVNINERDVGVMLADASSHIIEAQMEREEDASQSE